MTMYETAKAEGIQEGIREGRLDQPMLCHLKDLARSRLVD